MLESSAVVDTVRSAKAGDEAAWNLLVDNFSSMVWAVVRSVGLNEAEASDAHAATWMKLLTRIDSIREPERLPGWLRTTARNEAITVARVRSRVDLIEPHRFDWRVAAGSGTEDRVVAGEDEEAVRQAIVRLDDKCRELLRLLFGEPQLSYDEVAEILDRPIGAIGPTRRRCLEKLRGLL